MELLQIKDLTFRYPNAERNAVEGIELSIRGGEFLVVCGSSGCGKTTLLRLLKPELAPIGERLGSVTYLGIEGSPSEIGYVMQEPDSQIVTDSVWHELAFGLENLGLPTEVIRRRVGETASYFGLQTQYRRRTVELSGGQKQLLNLAAVTAMQPKLLILDEPTAQLDPIAASELIATLQRLNREQGLTIIVAEHRLEELLPIADRVLLMDGGKICLLDEPAQIGDALPPSHPVWAAMPSAVRIYRSLGGVGVSPLTVREGRDYLEERFFDRRRSLLEQEAPPVGQTALELRDVWFRYGRDGADVLRGACLRVGVGECFALLGGNGTGKTTLLRLLSGLRRAYRGKVLIGGRPIGAYGGNSLYRGVLACLPQDPRSVFVRETVRADLAEITQAHGISEEESAAQIRDLAERLSIGHLLERDPHDLSGGELQRCALAKVLLTKPRILLLDEPTKGIDACGKRDLAVLLRGLCAEGMTVLAVTHDVELAAQIADRCALFFDGEILSEGTPQQFFSGNNFYTTAANRIARGICPNAVTCAQVIELCKGGTEN